MNIYYDLDSQVVRRTRPGGDFLLQFLQWWWWYFCNEEQDMAMIFYYNFCNGDGDDDNDNDDACF